MLGDVLLIHDKHKNAAGAIAEKVLEKRKGKYVVAISGESGSGKSELAHCLAKEFKNRGIRSKIIHADNYYCTHPLKRKEWRMKNGINSVGFTEYDWDVLNRNISDYRNGRKSEMPCVDLANDQVDRLITDFSEIDLLIIDGLYAIKAEDANMRIFIDLTYHKTKLAQDTRGKESLKDEFRLQVLEREHVVMRSLRNIADLIVDEDYNVSEANK
ncbi:MAG: zeta toxin family protein [Bacteroidetes bacterium]|nr:zeta toxin family protein [Bacteroidota bacterium]